MIDKSELASIYDAVELLLQNGDESDLPTIAYKCDEIVGDHELESRAWFIGSRAYQLLNDPEAAMLRIDVALMIAAINVEYHFHRFNVLLQLGKGAEITSTINRVFRDLTVEGKFAMVGFIETAIATGLIHKNELEVDVAVEVLRRRLREE
jgi:hypothetical protein